MEQTRLHSEEPDTRDHQQQTGEESGTGSTENTGENTGMPAETPIADQVTGNMESSTANQTADDERNPAKMSENSTEQSEEENVNISELGFGEIAHWLKAAIEKNPESELRKQFSEIRNRFSELVEEAKQMALSAFTEDGGTEEDFRFNPSPEAIEIRDLIRKMNEKIREYRRNTERMLEANLLRKQDLISELQKLISEEPNMNKAFEKLRELQESWKQIGPVPKAQADNIYNTWRHYVNAFYDFASINKELYQIELKKNLEIKQDLIRQTRELMNVKSIKRSLELLHLIQKEWREVGPVPREMDKEIFEQFKNAYKAVYERRDEYFKQQDEVRKANLQVKENLCAEAEALATKEYESLKAWKEDEAKLKRLEDAWKKTGPVPKNANEAIWERFKSARKAFHKHRLRMLRDMSNRFDENYKNKVELCEKAEALKDSTDWKETTAKLIELQKKWKQIGPVDRKRSDAIWNRFRAACDHFFHAKEQWFAGREERDKESVEIRKAIIEELRAMQPLETVEEAIEQVKPLQEKWNQAPAMGPAERRNLEKAWNEALNAFFSKLDIDPVIRARLEYKAKLDSMLASPNALQLLRDERSYIGNRMRKLEEECIQIENNLAFFGHSKGADALKQQYLNKINDLRSEIENLKDRQHQVRNAIRQLES